jgi:holo-[acyl-carrier protein] synthase
MSILGLGTDICQTSRIEKVMKLKKDAFIKRLLTENEIHQAQNLDIAFLTRRYAAKEAVAKALGTGIGEGLSFHDFEIKRKGNERPTIHMLKKEFKNLTFHLSISDEKEYAVATVIIEK